MISRDVVFKEEEFPLKESGSKSEDSHLQHNELRFEIESDNEPDHTEMLLDHSVSEQTHGSSNHSDYKLARDRARRTIRAPQKLGYADLTAYAFIVATDLEEVEPIDYDQAVTCKEREKWLKAI